MQALCQLKSPGSSLAREDGQNVGHSPYKWSRIGSSTCTQHYCWGTQQTVKWRNCPSKILLPEKVFSENFRKKVFRKVSEKKLLPEEEFVTSESTRKYFRKNVIRKFLEEPSSESYLFKKNYFVII